MGLFNRLFGRSNPAATAAVKQPEPLLINAYATVHDLPVPDFPHELHAHRDNSNPEMAPHLEGFTGYVMSRGDGAMTATRYHLWRHIQRVRHQVSFSIAEDRLAEVEGWARKANAIMFLPDGSVRAPDMQVLIAADGSSDPAAALPYPDDAIQRHTRTLELLSGFAPQPPASMPPALGEAEVVLRPAETVVKRALALFAVAAQAEALGQGERGFANVLRERNPDGIAALTGKERAFFDNPQPSDGDASSMSWRYEALGMLLWSLSLADLDPAQATAPVDVSALSAMVLRLAEDKAFRQSVRLRPAGEILDALDLAWRQHWIVRQARQTGSEPDGLNPDIIMERHYALNWLTGFHNPPGTHWDDIDTPT